MKPEHERLWPWYERALREAAKDRGWPEETVSDMLKEIDEPFYPLAARAMHAMLDRISELEGALERIEYLDTSATPEYGEPVRPGEKLPPKMERFMTPREVARATLTSAVSDGTGGAG